MKKINDGITRIVFAGGGTGGHIYPGIAVADEVRKIFEEKGKKIEIYWIGSSSGMDENIVQSNLLSSGGSINAFYGIPCGKLRRYLSLKNISDMFRILAGCFKAKKILKKLKPDFLFSKGGFVSVPPCLAAKSLKIPYFTHECDFTPGLATRLNAGGAEKILLSYSDTEKYIKENLRKKCLVTGNPVRPVFYQKKEEEGKKFLGISRSEKKPVLLVLGGSLGARQINSLVMENLEWLKERFIVVHQTGKAFAEENPDVMKSFDSSYKPYAFIYKEMPSVIQSADVILSRSGANSIWECAVSAKPMILVPLCGSGTRGDQVDNARYFEKAGAAFVLAGEDANSEKLREKLTFFLDSDNRKKYSENSAKLSGFKPASSVIAEEILKTLEEKS